MAISRTMMFSSQNVLFFHILVIFYSFSSAHIFSPTLDKLPIPSTGPVCIDFDIFGRGPYTGVADGRILKYQRPANGFVDFAYTSPNRNQAFCDGINTTDFLSTCGRPIGVGFHYATGQLYVTDAAYGLLVVGTRGGLATQLATSADGVPLRSPDSLDVDQVTGNVYFTDPSTEFGLNDFQQLLTSRNATGRLLKYDPRTKQVTVLLSKLLTSSGVAVSKDGCFLVVSEYLNSRVLKYWLKGPRANTSEILVNFTGNPDKIRRTIIGDFWVGVNVQQGQQFELRGVRFDEFGNVHQTIMFSPQFQASLITEVHQFYAALFLGSTDGQYVGVYRPYIRL